MNRTCKDRDVYIGGKETSGSEVPEHTEAVDKDENDSPEYAPDGQIRLKTVPIDKRFAVDILGPEAIVYIRSYEHQSPEHRKWRPLTEAQVGQVDGEPGEETPNGGQADEPGERLSTRG